MAKSALERGVSMVKTPLKGVLIMRRAFHTWRVRYRNLEIATNLFDLGKVPEFPKFSMFMGSTHRRADNTRA